MKNRSKSFQLVIVAAVFVACFAASTVFAANTWYVDPVNGSMSYNGSTYAPWSTIEEVFDNGLIETKNVDGTVVNPGAPIKAGDTILLRSGYHGHIEYSGAFNDDYITIKAEEGHEPKLSYIRINGGKKWIFKGLTICPLLEVPFTRPTMIMFYSRWAHGICSDMIVEDCFMYSILDSSNWTATDWNTYSCNAINFDIGGENLIARNNYMLNVNFALTLQAEGSLAEYNEVKNFAGDGIRITWHNITAQYNLIQNPYDVNANHDDGVQGFLANVGPGEVTDATVRGNIIINRTDPLQPHPGTMQGIGCFDGPYTRWRVENNAVLTDHWHGITIYSARGCEIVNNTVFNKQYMTGESTRFSWIDISGGTDEETSNLIRNNIAHRYTLGGTRVNDHNLTITDTTDITGWFTDYINDDLSLLETCPAIDAGTDVLAPDKDRNERLRPLGDNIDIGAYEFGQADLTATVSAMPTPGMPGFSTHTITLDCNDVIRNLQFTATAAPVGMLNQVHPEGNLTPLQDLNYQFASVGASSAQDTQMKFSTANDDVLMSAAVQDSNDTLDVSMDKVSSFYNRQIAQIVIPDGATADFSGVVNIFDVDHPFVGQVSTDDTTIPMATLAPVEVTLGSNEVVLEITYADNFMLDASSIDTNDIRVTGPNGFNQMATLESVSSTVNGTPITATYRIAGPDGQWDETDEGFYSVVMESAQVSDTSGNVVVDGPVGQFGVNIATGDAIVGRYLFYNNSAFDNNNDAANSDDDNAIATDKQPLMAGQVATFENYSNYDKGINGVMIDMPIGSGSLSVNDFQFKIGNNMFPDFWGSAPAPVAITNRFGEGQDGSNRVTIIWADGEISKLWLQVTILANGNTTLEENDVFYFGNAVGETGNMEDNCLVDAADEIGCRNHPRSFMRPAAVDHVYDINRDKKVNATDQIIVRNNTTDFTNDLILLVAP